RVRGFSVPFSTFPGRPFGIGCRKPQSNKRASNKTRLGGVCLAQGEVGEVGSARVWITPKNDQMEYGFPKWENQDSGFASLRILLRIPSKRMPPNTTNKNPAPAAIPPNTLVKVPSRKCHMDTPVSPNANPVRT